MIVNLELCCNDLSEQEFFYGTILELPVKRISRDSLEITAGKTKISFNADENFKKPQYHFAFNIPENKLVEASEWLKKKNVILTKNQDGAEIFNFINWNAHAIYFLDPAGNIVEFIARHNLSNKTDDPFSADGILYASEIGLVVNDVEKQVNYIKKGLGFEIYKVSSSDFAAIGTEYNLLILASRGRPWFGSSQNIPAQTFPVKLRLGAPVMKGELKFADHPFTIYT